MTDASYTHYILVIDRSGSMDPIKDESQSGIRQFIEEQRQLPGRATITLTQFDTEYQSVYDFATLEEASQNPYTLVPRGLTALRDAIGFTMTTVGAKLAAMAEDERPGKVVVLIVTDGDDNFSSEYSPAQVKAMIEEQQDTYGWAFSYIGANVDAFGNAQALGIAEGSVLSYASAAIGTANAWSSISANTRSYVGGQTANLSYSDADREAAKEE